MIAQKSKNSQIYHRIGCRFINQIKEESLMLFDYSSPEQDIFKPCKCCCTIKQLFKDSQTSVDCVLRVPEATYEVERDFLNVNTPQYKWRVFLDPISQIVKLYLVSNSEDNENVSLVRIREIENSHSLSSALKYISKEEVLSVYPQQYREYAAKINSIAEEKNIEINYDGTDLYVLTDIAAWKIACVKHFDSYKLLHCPFKQGRVISMDEAKNAHYHVQKDVLGKKTPVQMLKYIVSHDYAKKIEKDNYRKLPNSTKKQKKYYHQAENRARKKSVQRVFAIFDEWDAKTKAM